MSSLRFNLGTVVYFTVRLHNARIVSAKRTRFRKKVRCLEDNTVSQRVYRPESAILGYSSADHVLSTLVMRAHSSRSARARGGGGAAAARVDRLEAGEGVYAAVS